MANTPLYLLKDRRPDSCFLDQIYDPDRDGPPSDGMAHVIPREGAAVFDRDNNYAIYTVIAVDPITYKSTIAPAKIVKTAESEEIRVISYGNDKFMLYYDDRVKPTELNISGNLMLFGSSLADYRLHRIGADGKKEFISLYVDTNETYKGDRIPLAALTPGSPIKKCTNCHTLSTLRDGETVTLEIHDHAGLLAVELQLFVKRGIPWNDLLSNTSVVIGFDATANQMRGSDFYIHQRQPVNQLVISPRLTYSDGSTEDLVVDNVSCFLYGLETFVPSFPGQRQKILLKKYLGRNQVSPNQETVGKMRFLTLYKWVTVITNKSMDGIKVSVMPQWNPATRKYDLRFIAYSDRRDKIYDVTPYTELITSFDGGIFNMPQNVLFEIDLSKIFGAEASVLYRQNVVLNLKHYNEFQRYTISDGVDSPYTYGVESSNMRRPVVHYDGTLHQYYIPTSRFLNKEAFIEAYYTAAMPPYDPDLELGPVPPTHFTIRDPGTLATIITDPIPVDQYTQAWNTLSTGDPGQYVGGQVIVEFLREMSGQYQMLYGVPVDVHLSPSGYNTENNP